MYPARGMQARVRDCPTGKSINCFRIYCNAALFFFKKKRNVCLFFLSFAFFILFLALHEKPGFSCFFRAFAVLAPLSFCCCFRNLHWKQSIFFVPAIATMPCEQNTQPNCGEGLFADKLCSSPPHTHPATRTHTCAPGWQWCFVPH